MRLAGTCSRYSNSAIPQLASAAMNHGRPDRSFRCAYYAKVMKTFESVSSTMAMTAGGRLNGMVEIRFVKRIGRENAGDTRSRGNPLCFALILYLGGYRRSARHLRLPAISGEIAT